MTARFIVARPGGSYVGLTDLLRDAEEAGVLVHVATRATCAEHIEAGDDKATWYQADTDRLARLRQGIDAELDLLPAESDMSQFEHGAAAAYSHVLSLFPETKP